MLTLAYFVRSTYGPLAEWSIAVVGGGTMTGAGTATGGVGAVAGCDDATGDGATGAEGAAATRMGVTPTGAVTGAVAGAVAGAGAATEIGAATGATTGTAAEVGANGATTGGAAALGPAVVVDVDPEVVTAGRPDVMPATGATMGSGTTSATPADIALDAGEFAAANTAVLPAPVDASPAASSDELEAADWAAPLLPPPQAESATSQATKHVLTIVRILPTE